MQANNATRKKGFKKGVEVEDARRRRNDTTVQIRKEKKEDQIQKRRAVSVLLFSNVGVHSRIVTFCVCFLQMPTLGDSVTSSSARNDPVLKVTEATPQQILEHRENVLSEDPQRQLQSTQHFRRLLSIGEYQFLCAADIVVCSNNISSSMDNRKEPAHSGGD